MIWDDNSIQFPRLLAEIMATQDDLDIAALAEVLDLFERAQNEWERIKLVTCPPQNS
jgi:hypothetical protein